MSAADLGEGSEEEGVRVQKQAQRAVEARVRAELRDEAWAPGGRHHGAACLPAARMEEYRLERQRARAERRLPEGTVHRLRTMRGDGALKGGMLSYCKSSRHNYLGTRAQ